MPDENVPQASFFLKRCALFGNGKEKMYIFA